MQVTTTYKPSSRAVWRGWLEQNQGTAQEIWVLLDDRPGEPTVLYLDAVEEAICFGWIDSIQKRFSPYGVRNAFPRASSAAIGQN